MNARTKYMIVLVALCMALVFISPCHCGRLLLRVFANDRKAATQSVYKTMKALSDIHCASLFGHDGNAVTFSFNEQQQTCELGDQLPEDSNEEAEGWTLVAKIVDGVWEEWQSWGTCSVTRTRTRLCLEPSNGGALCTGSDTEEENCVPPNTLLPVVSETLSTNFTVRDWEPSKAADGDMYTASMSSYAYESVRIQPYWRAEFGSTWSISTVKLFIHEKSQSKGVEVSLQDVTLTESCGAKGSETDASHIMPCTYTSTNGPHETTFLHIQLQTANEVLEIYEMERSAYVLFYGKMTMADVNALIEKCPYAEIATCGEILLSGLDVSTLNPNTWLNDQVINGYMSLIATNYRDVAALDVFFFQCLVSGKSPEKFVNRDLFNKGTILVPVIYRKHWTLLVIHEPEATIHVYNSMTSGGRHPAEMLRRYMNSRGDASYVVRTVEDLPQQTKNEDCGVFVCQYALCLAAGKSGKGINFAPDDIPCIRRKMMFESIACSLL